MPDVGRHVEEWLAGTAEARADLVKTAVSSYFSGLGGGSFPADHELEAALDRTRSCLAQGLRSLPSPSSLADEDGQVGTSGPPVILPQGVDETSLQVVPPTRTERLSRVRVLLVVLVGGVLGIVVLRLAFGGTIGVRDFVVAFGASLAAAGTLVAASWTSYRRWAPHWLKEIVTEGVAQYDRGAHEAAVRAAVEQWLAGAAAIQAALQQAAAIPRSSPGEVAAQKALKRIGKALSSVQRASAGDLPLAVEELIQEARSAGFDSLGDLSALSGESSPSKKELAWVEDLSDRYDAYGHVEPGDRVLVERETVTFCGEVLERGIVRKVR